MKTHLITFLLLLTSTLSFSQNGGQFRENNVASIRLIAYSDGNYIFTVKNKQNCVAIIRTKVDTDPAVDYTVNPNDSVWVYIPRPPLTQIKFRAKAETSCPGFTNPDMGFLEIIDALGVLSLNEDNLIRPIRTQSKYEVSLVGGVLKSNFGQFNNNQTIIIYDGFGRVHFKQTNMVFKRYEIDIKNFLVNGLNIICVYVDNKTYDYHVFRVVK